jgi:hypothetical protein
MRCNALQRSYIFGIIPVGFNAPLEFLTGFIKEEYLPSKKISIEKFEKVGMSC